MDYRRRAVTYRQSLAAAGAAHPKPFLWRMVRLGRKATRRDLRQALLFWSVAVVVGIGGVATRSRWGITIGVIFILIGSWGLARVVRCWRDGSRRT